MALNATVLIANLPYITAIFIPLLTYILWPYIYPLFCSLQYTNRHGGELVANVLKAHNVEYMFTLVGGHISPILVAAKKIGIRVIDVRHEVNAVFAADAVSRLSGSVGVAVVTAGPGVTNTITALKNAQMAQSPLLLIGGAAATVLKGRGSLQDVEQIAVLQSVVKYHASIRNVREIVPVLRRAFYEAQNGVPGPVFVEIPIDCLYCIGELRAAMNLSQCMRKKELKSDSAEYTRVIVPYEFEQRENRTFDAAVIARYLATQTDEQPIFIDLPKKRNPFIVEKYLQYQCRYLFAGAFDTRYDYSPYGVDNMCPSVSDANTIIKLLLQAKNPCLIISSQTLSQSGKADQIRAAVETIAIPTFLSSMARGLLGRDHKLYIKQGRTAALRESDVIILCGVMVDFRLNYGRALNRRAKIVTINRCFQDLRMNTDMFWKPHLQLQFDPGEALLLMAQEIQGSFAVHYKERVSSVFNAWTEGLKDKERATEQKNQLKAQSPSYPRKALNMKTNVKEVINPLLLCAQVEQAMDENSIIIVDGGDFAATAAYMCRPRGPLKWMDPGPFGTLGVGAGFALGAKLVNPNDEIWLIWGDGSSGYSIAEIDTLKRFGIGVICIIGNDACWSQIEREQIPKLGDNTACMIQYCDYDVVSKGYGGDGETVWDKTQIQDALKRAKEFVKSNNAPYVINAHIGITDFREGSISV